MGYGNTGTMLDALPDVDHLLAERDRLVKLVKPLRAKFGGTGNYIAERYHKLEEAKLAAAVRASIKAGQFPDGEKATEGAIDVRVRTHPGYEPLLTAEVKERQEWIQHEEDLKTVEWRLQMRKADGYLLGNEAGLTPNG